MSESLNQFDRIVPSPTSVSGETTNMHIPLSLYLCKLQKGLTPCFVCEVMSNISSPVSADLTHG